MNLKTKKIAIVMGAGLVVGLTPVAQAEPVKPSGIYSESRLSGDESTTGAAAGVSSVGVKQWVKHKISTLTSLWSAPAPRAGGERLAASGEQPRAVSERKVASLPEIPAQGDVAVAGPSGPAPIRALTAPPAGSASEEKVFVPPTAGGQQLAAPAAAVAPTVDVPGVKHTRQGVAVYDIATSPKIPFLKLGGEEKVKASQYALDTRMQKVMDDRVITAFPSPDMMLDQQFRQLAKITTGQVARAQTVRDVTFGPKGKVSREAFDRIVLNLKPENALKLGNFVELTTEEMRFLSGLLLFQQGDKCSSAVGIFHKLSKSKGWEAEADYFLAMCSRKLGLETDFFERATRILELQDVHYARKILKEVGSSVPYEFVDRFGLALFKASTNPKIMDKLDPKIAGNVAYLLTEFGASTERFKTALEWSKKVPADHPKYLQSRFVASLAEYQNGSKDQAMQMAETLINDLAVDSTKAEFQALVALNAARMYFQEQKFKEAHKAFLRVYKDHPLWLQSLTELGWSQLQSGDAEGAIGNMYSIQSPFFRDVYKPESFVIRTIGYLNLCQYGDAYKTLSILEHEYRPVLDKVERYSSAKPSYYQTVRNFLSAPKTAKEIDGLPSAVVREIARHRDFTNLQKALNRQLDERPMYAKFDGDVERAAKRAESMANGSRRRIADLRRKIGVLTHRGDLEQNRAQLNLELEQEMNALNGYFFQVDLYKEAKAALPDYRAEVIGGADRRLSSIRGNLERILATRILRMKTDLARMLENNELLRYEVFAGSGENIRFQVSGGETSRRVPASVLPKSKALQWDFDGEYWEDEIGHYRSTLKNNCPDAVRVKQASLEGENE